MKLPNFTHLLYGVGEHDTTQQNTTQHNTTQHNTTEHKIGLNCELKKKITSHLDLQNCSLPTQPHSIIAKYLWM